MHRFWKQEGLRVPARVREKRRLGDSANRAKRPRAERSSQASIYDFVWDQTGQKFLSFISWAWLVFAQKAQSYRAIL